MVNYLRPIPRARSSIDRFSLLIAALIALVLALLTCTQVALAATAPPVSTLSDSGVRHSAEDTAILSAATVTAKGEVLPGSPLYPFKRLWERVRLAFTWNSAKRAIYLAGLIQTRTAEMAGAIGKGETKFAESLARDQERLVQQAQRALAKIKIDDQGAALFRKAGQAVEAAWNNMGQVGNQLPEAARGALEDMGHRLGQGVRDFLDQLEKATKNVIVPNGKGGQKQGEERPGKK
jgi:hypothetical protein